MGDGGKMCQTKAKQITYLRVKPHLRNTFSFVSIRLKFMSATDDDGNVATFDVRWSYNQTPYRNQNGGKGRKRQRFETYYWEHYPLEAYESLSVDYAQNRLLSMAATKTNAKSLPPFFLSVAFVAFYTVTYIYSNPNNRL